MRVRRAGIDLLGRARRPRVTTNQSVAVDVSSAVDEVYGFNCGIQ